MSRLDTFDDLVSSTRAITQEQMAFVMQWFRKHMMQRLVNVLMRKVYT